MTNIDMQKLNQEIYEQFTWDVMSSIDDYIKVYGCNTFKTELKKHNNDRYEEIFFPQTKSEKCFLTNPN